MILSIALNPAIDKVYEVDDFCVGQVFRPKAMTSTAGGKGLNVARVARLLGEVVTVTGFVGGNNGRYILQRIQAEGIDNRFLEIGKETRICIAVMDRNRNTSTEVLEPGPFIESSETEAFISLYEELVSKAELITASGSLPAGLPKDIYKTLVVIAKNHQKKFILDTSGQSLKSSIGSLPYMVKPNLDEMESLLGEKIPDIKKQAIAVANLKKSGICLPCLSLGKDGCLAALEDGVYKFGGPKVKVLNTVGSGDAFVAGCAVALRRGADRADVIKMGMACGVANTQFFETGMVSKELVDNFFKEIKLEKIA